MASPSFEPIQLQMAMAFGQGAGVMLASPEALAFALSENAALIRRAAGDWTASRPAFIELVRLLGQIAATRAAMDNKAEIGPEHIKEALPAALGPCPCSLPT